MPFVGVPGCCAVVPDGTVMLAVPGMIGLLTSEIEGLPATPSAFVIEIGVTTFNVLVFHVDVPVLTAKPLVVKFSTAFKSSDNESTMFPDVVIGLFETVMPADGYVNPTLVTVPEPPAAMADHCVSPLPIFE